MSLKRKQRMKLKAYSPEENKYHLMFNNVLSSDSDLLQTNTHKGCCILNANEYNYNINTWNIKRQVVGYIMSLKRKQRMKLKTYIPEENKY